jgi:hypothetical protein
VYDPNDVASVLRRWWGGEIADSGEWEPDDVTDSLEGDSAVEEVLGELFAGIEEVRREHDERIAALLANKRLRHIGILIGE